MNKILLVEDDSSLGMGVEFALKGEGYDVFWAKNVFEAKSFLHEDYGMAVLDVNLPDGNGYELCKLIKKEKDVPVMFLTALDDEVNVVLGLEIGGDDYLTKPFRVREFLSRVKILLKRGALMEELRNAARQGSGSRSASEHDGIVGFDSILVSGDITVDTSLASVKKDGKEVLLTAQEYKLLLILITNSRKIMSRTEILALLKEGEELFFDENTLSVYIKRLREKIEADSVAPKYIITHRGLGYVWNVPLGGETVARV